MTLEAIRWQDSKLERLRHADQSDNLTVEQILNHPRDQDLVLEGRRMYQALDALQSTREFAQSCTSQQIEVIRACKSLRLVFGSPPIIQYDGPLMVRLGYALGRTWLALV